MDSFVRDALEIIIMASPENTGYKCSLKQTSEVVNFRQHSIVETAARIITIAYDSSAKAYLSNAYY